MFQHIKGKCFFSFFLTVIIFSVSVSENNLLCKKDWNDATIYVETLLCAIVKHVAWFVKKCKYWLTFKCCNNQTNSMVGNILLMFLFSKSALQILHCGICALSYFWSLKKIFLSLGKCNSPTKVTCTQTFQRKKAKMEEESRRSRMLEPVGMAPLHRSPSQHSIGSLHALLAKQLLARAP